MLFSGHEKLGGEEAYMVNLRGAHMMLSKGKKVGSEDGDEREERGGIRL